MLSAPTGGHRDVAFVLAIAIAAAAARPARADESSDAARGPAHRVDLAIDIPVTLIAGAVSFSWTRKGELEPAHCAPLCDADPLLFIDRPAAGAWHPRWAAAGNVVLPAMMAAAGGVVALHEDSLSGAATDLFVMTQTIAVSSAAHVLTAMATRRPRPLVYGTEAPEEVRLDPEHALSFYSGHVAAAFAMSVSTYTTLAELAPDSRAPELALGIGLAGSVVVSMARVRSGLHFPTDALAGAAVGTSLALVIPAFHRRSESSLNLAPAASGSMKGLTLSGRF